MQKATIGGWKIKKEIAGHGRINPKNYSREEYDRIILRMKPRRGIVTQLAGSPEGRRFQSTVRKIRFTLNSLPDNKANALTRAKLQRRLAKLMK